MEFFKKEKKYFWLLVGIFLAVVFAFVFWGSKKSQSPNKSKDSFYFSGSGNDQTLVLEEAASFGESSNTDWWLNSGAKMRIEKYIFSTNFGKLSKKDSWRKLYDKNNSRDTDNGYYPQNIFRLVTRTKWLNFTQQVYFNISKINLSESDFRNESNGVLLFNRYQNGDNLYYTGIRVDGDVVIKKKIADKYYTLAEKNLLTNERKYDRIENPNQLPVGSWMGIKSEVFTVNKDTVGIKLYFDREGHGNWELALETEDKAGKNGKTPITEAGYGGIRTDFMDVSFRGYEIEEK